MPSSHGQFRLFTMRFASGTVWTNLSHNHHFCHGFCQGSITKTFEQWIILPNFWSEARSCIIQSCNSSFSIQDDTCGMSTCRVWSDRFHLDPLPVTFALSDHVIKGFPTDINTLLCYSAVFDLTYSVWIPVAQPIVKSGLGRPPLKAPSTL